MGLQRLVYVFDPKGNKLVDSSGREEIRSAVRSIEEDWLSFFGERRRVIDAIVNRVGVPSSAERVSISYGASVEIFELLVEFFASPPPLIAKKRRAGVFALEEHDELERVLEFLNARSAHGHTTVFDSWDSTAGYRYDPVETFDLDTWS